MTAPEISQICTSVGTLIGVIVTAVLTLRNGTKSDQNAKAIANVHEAVNGKAEARNEATSLSSFAAGAEAQRVQEGGTPNAQDTTKPHIQPILKQP